MKIQSAVFRGGLSLLAALFLSIPVAMTTPRLEAAPASQASKKVDVNNADAKTLESLPGVGPAMAQRIIESRPYKKAADLEKVQGLSKAKVDALKGQITFGPTAAAATKKAQETAKAAKEKPAAKEAQKLSPTGRVDVNSADAKALEELPGIGPALAQRIIENRPYKNASDLEKVKGLTKSKVDALKGQITFGATAGTKTGRQATTTTKENAPPKGAQSTAPAGKVDLNTADAKALQELPGIGAVLAQRIIENRPYKSLADLEKVKGLSQSKIENFKDQVTVGAPETAAKAPDRTPKATRSTEGAGAPTGRASEQLAAGEKVNINTANAEELDKLFGIGPVKSQAIIDYRQQHGNFKSIEEIKNVAGIKEGVFEKIKDHISVGR